jgi:hypothetical protein
LRSDDPIEKSIEVLRDSLVFGVWSQDPLARFESWSILAASQGALVVSNAPYFDTSGFECDEEYFLVSQAYSFVDKIKNICGTPSLFSTMHIRSWQKVREILNANEVYRKLLVDRELFAPKK